MSGSGMVSKEVTDEQLLDSWRDVLHKWQQNVKQRPKQVLLLGNRTPVMSSKYRVVAGEVARAQRCSRSAARRGLAAIGWLHRQR